MNPKMNARIITSLDYVEITSLDFDETETEYDNFAAARGIMDNRLITNLDYVKAETGEDDLDAARGIIYCLFPCLVAWMMILYLLKI